SYNDGQNLIFSNFADLIGGSGNDNFMLAGGSVTSINGGAGSNTLTGNNSGDGFNISAANSGSVTGLVTGFSNIQNLTGGTGNDTFTLSGTGNLSGVITGGGGVDTLVGNNLTNTWAISGVNAGTLSDANGSNSFAGITNLTGGSGNDTLTGVAGGSNWSITGANAVSVSGMNATSMEALVGGAGTDVFTLASDVPTFNGSITGGGGVDTLAATNGTNAWIITSANTGSLNVTTVFSGITNLTGGSGSDTLTGVAGGSNWSITGANAVSVSGMNASSMEALVGGTGTDVFTLASGVPTFNGTLTGGGGTDTLAATDGINVWQINAANAGTLNTTTVFSGITNLTGGAGNDTFGLSGTGNISGVITGGGGNETLTGNNLTNTWSISGSNSGTLTDSNGTNNFTGISNLTGGTGADSFTLSGSGNISGVISGGGGSDTLVGNNLSNTWAITGANAGTLTDSNGSNHFSGISNLTGGSGDDDFVFSDGQGVSGTVDGGAGGNNVLDFSAYSTAVAIMLTGSNPFGYSGSTSATPPNPNPTGGFAQITQIDAPASLANTLALQNGIASTVTINSSVPTNLFNLTVNVSGAPNLVFSNIGTVNGGTGVSNTLISGEATSNIWTLTSANGGSYNDGQNLIFSNFADLIGGSGNDNFMLAGGSVTSINGGAGSN
ncbi:MAG: beta strand repeat-containing protein, partial [Streptosporangiaceae bacterium]